MYTAQGTNRTIGGQLSSRSLSAGEESLWLLQEELRSGAYNEGVLLRMPVGADVSQLKEAVCELARRHPALRTTYHLTAQGLVATETTAEETIDFKTLKVASEAEACKSAEADFGRPFELDRHVTRIVFYQLSDRIIMLVALHHIACDGWSMLILQGSLAQILKEQGTPAGEVSEMQLFKDFVLEENNYLRSDQYRTDEAYWKERLEGAGECSRLFRIAGEPGYVCLTKEVSVSRTALNAAAEENGVSRFVVALSAAQLALASFLDEPDLVIGTPFSNRDRKRSGSTVGLFTNNLVLRQKIDLECPVSDHFKNTRSTLGGAIRHGRFPYSHLIRLSRHELADGDAPYQLYFSYRETPAELLANPEFDIIGHPKKSAPNFDLHLEVLQAEHHLHVYLHVNSARYSSKLAEQLLAAYADLIPRLLVNPGSRIDAVAVLPPSDSESLMALSMGETRNYSTDEGFIAAFRKGLPANGSYPAVTDGTTSWSYSELDAWSDTLGRQLIDTPGWERGSVVGVFLPRGIRLVASMLAIWKAGGIYLPLDPALPQERIGQMVDDSGLSLVINSSIETLFSDTVRQVLFPASVSTSPSTLFQAACGDEGAYLLYTSGSTGKPKGVLVAQSGMMNHLFSKVDDLHLHSGTRLGQTATQNFDVSIWQMLSPLLAGGLVCIADRDTAADPARLLMFLKAQEISVVQMVPSFLNAVLDQCQRVPVALPSLRFLVCAGEALPAGTASRWQELFPGATVFNGYGPTEGSDNIAVYTLPPRFSAATVPIGRPLANLHLYVVNSMGQLAPQGAIGELWVSGIGVAIGYRGDEELTRTVFMEDPFFPGRRAYRTGDLARWNDAGLLEFHGRKDFQVKIRGQRVEPGEVEAVMLKQGSVSNVCVHYWPRNGGWLCAYAVPRSGCSISEEEILNYVRERLPAYMVPDAVHIMQELPATSSGKIARGLLPDPEVVREQRYQPPSTETEKLLCSIWEDVLQRRPIGTGDIFFRIGGHSLLLAQVANRITEQFEVTLPFSTLYRLRDIQSLARYIDLQVHTPADIVLEEISI
jgi:amino acid adenylation domain-containing protein